MFNTNQILLVLVSLVVLVMLYTKFSKPIEKLTDTSKNKDKLANDILNFLNNNTTYKQYLDFIVRIPYNLSTELVKQEVFYEMKFLHKNNKLNKNEIKKLITDM